MKFMRIFVGFLGLCILGLMASASLRSACDLSALNEVGSDEDVSSIISTDNGPRATSGVMAAEKKSKDGKASNTSKGKEKSSTTSSSSSSARKAAKLSDLEKLESKIVDQMTSKFESFDGKFDRLFSLFSAQNSDSGARRSDNNVDSGTSGERRPLNTERNDTSGGRSISLNNELDTEFGLDNHVLVPSEEESLDVISLQPGQRERRSMGLLSSEGSDGHSVASDCEREDATRFGKYTDSNQPELNKDILREMFGDDAEANSKSSKGLSLDKTQMDIINSSWRCQAPDKLSAFRDAYKHAFPIQLGTDTEKLLQVPSLDELSERLLIKKHGRRAAFGSTQTLFSQPFKSMEKIAYQGQVAARMGIISMCYAQQALGSLLQNLKGSTPNIDEAVQNVRDIFAISTKALDQFCRTGAFHHLVRRKATVADTGMHEFKDLQKAALTSPLAGEGIFGEEFEKKLKNRQEKDKQLSDLMPEVGKRPFTKRKSSFPSDSSAPKKTRNYEDSYNQRSSFRSGNSYNSGFKKAFKGSYSSGYKNNSSKPTSVSGFRPQGGKFNKS